MKYARQMGNDYILYKDGMERNKDVDGMLFYLESPEYSVYPVPRLIYKDRDYTPEEMALYEEYFAWKSDDPFPNNMATGFSWGYTDRIGVEFDLQQQKVIDYIVDSTLALARDRERCEGRRHRLQVWRDCVGCAGLRRIPFLERSPAWERKDKASSSKHMDWERLDLSP